jgi:hypothetical protein
MSGSMFRPLLTEVTSYGYIVIANGTSSDFVPIQASDMMKLRGFKQDRLSDL